MGAKFSTYNTHINHSIYYHYNDVLSMLMLLRAVELIPVILTLTQWESMRAARIWYSTILTLSKMTGAEVSTLFSLKCLMKEKPFRVVFSGLLMIVIIFAQALRLAEGPINRVVSDMDHSQFANSLWSITLVITTSTPKRA